MKNNIINKGIGATETFNADTWLYQRMDSIVGIPYNEESHKALHIRKGERLMLDEVSKISSLTSHPDYGSHIVGLLNGSIENDEFGVIKPLIDFLHQKRIFVFKDREGNSKLIGIPTDREIGKGFCSFSKGLLSCALRYKSYLEADDKLSAWKSFEGSVFALQKAIACRLFSKKFKEKLDFTFKGLSGVALTGNVTLNGVIIPKWYANMRNLKIGDLMVVTRDPIQNIFISLKIEGFSKNEIRVNAHTFTFLGGDFDGDKIQVIPFTNIKAELENRKCNSLTISTILYELVGLLPSHLFANKKFSRLLRDYEWIDDRTFIDSTELDENILLSSSGKKLIGAPLINRLNKIARDMGLPIVHDGVTYKG